MDEQTRKSAIAAAIILGGFGLFAFFLPNMMLALGNISTVAAGVFGALFVLAFFGVFWLRARSQQRNDKDGEDT